MRTKLWICCGLASLAAAGAFAQTNSVALRYVNEKVAKDLPLGPPATAVLKVNAVNVRGQPDFAGDVIMHLAKGTNVTVLDQISMKKHKKGEPSEWSRIILPPEARTFVFAQYVDANMTITARRVNVRDGAGENFDVVGTLQKGETVKEIRRAQGWVQIEVPTNAWGYVASEYLDLQPASTTTPTAPPPSAPEVASTTPSTPAASTNTMDVAVAAPPPSAPVPAPSAPPPSAPAPTAPPPSAPPTAQEIAAANDAALKVLQQQEATALSGPPRVVTREGYLRYVNNPTAPTDFELRDIRSGHLTEFLQLAPGQTVEGFYGFRVTVTGTEEVDKRWPDVPILLEQSISLLP